MFFGSVTCVDCVDHVMDFNVNPFALDTDMLSFPGYDLLRRIRRPDAKYRGIKKTYALLPPAFDASWISHQILGAADPSSGSAASTDVS